MSIDTSTTAFNTGDVVQISTLASRFGGRFAKVVEAGTSTVGVTIIGEGDEHGPDHVTRGELLTVQPIVRHMGGAMRLPAPGSLIYVVEAIDSEALPFIGQTVRTVLHDRSDFVRIPYLGTDGEFGAAVGAFVVLDNGVTPEEWDKRVKKLTGERDTLAHALTRANERFEQRDGEFEDTVDKIGARLLQEAEGRNWCGEFNDIVEEVNGELPVYKLPMREQEYDVEVEVEGRMRTTVRLRITAFSQDEADEEGMGMNASQIDENLSSNGLDSIDAQLTQRASRRSFDDLEVVEN